MAKRYTLYTLYDMYTIKPQFNIHQSSGHTEVLWKFLCLSLPTYEHKQLNNTLEHE